MAQILNEIPNLNASKYEIESDQFIHFDNRSTLYEFVRQYQGNVAFFCCEGKGCKLTGVTSNEHVQQIKKDFLQKNVLLGKIIEPPKIMTEECALCYESEQEEAVLPCSHSFCVGCINHLKKSSLPNLCPLCRASFSE